MILACLKPKKWTVTSTGRLTWDYYQDTDGDGSPERASSEIDTDYDGKPDVFTYFRDGKVIRKERDTNGDDRIDHWEKYDADGKA